MLKRIAPALLLMAGLAAAQQPVAPTPAEVGSPRGTNLDDYNVTNSFELGYRFAAIGGDEGKYRSDVNYGNGIRLLGSQFTVNSRDGHGRYFDEIVLTTLGLGNDPYESATLRVQKNRLYQYDLMWRSDQFFNPALAISSGEHFLDTRRLLQDHDLLLFPQSRARLHFGFTRNTQTGPALTTIQLFDDRGDEFPLFQNVHRQWTEWRLGGDFLVFGGKLTLLRYWTDFRDDSPLALDGSTAGNNPNDQVALSQFHRAEPYHGTSPGWLVNLNRPAKAWSANGRFTYVGGRRNFLQDEMALGTDRFGALNNRQVLVTGDASRPESTGDFSFSYFPGSRLTLVNSTGFHNIRIGGNSTYAQFDNATASLNLLYFRFLGVKLVENSTDAQYRFTKWLTLAAGYRYSSRHIESSESFTFPGTPAQPDTFQQENHLHAGTLGFRLKPAAPVTITVDGEIGRADHPFTPLSDRNYHILGGRFQYRTRQASLSASYRQNYNNNSVSLFSFSSHARTYSANASWTPRDWFGLDAGYNKLHLDSVSGIAFFENLPRLAFVQGLNSVYVSNIHAGSLNARFVVKKRVDIYAGYSITKDVGDGRAAPGAGFLAAVETFPLSFQSPQARVSIRINPRLRWNAGWQFYRYREQFGLFGVFQNYRAHTGYTSILWSF